MPLEHTIAEAKAAEEQRVMQIVSKLENARKILRKTRIFERVESAENAANEAIEEITNIVIGDDGVPPETPPAPTVTPFGRALAVVWPLPELEDFVESTDVELKIVSSGVTTLTRTRDVSVVLQGLLREPYEVRIKHYDRWGNGSEWSASTEETPLPNAADTFSEELEITADRITGQLDIDQMPDLDGPDGIEKLVDAVRGSIEALQQPGPNGEPPPQFISADIVASIDIVAVNALLANVQAQEALFQNATIGLAQIDEFNATTGVMANLKVTNAQIESVTATKVTGGIFKGNAMQLATSLEVGVDNPDDPSKTGRIFVNVGGGTGPTIDKTGFALNSYTAGGAGPDASGDRAKWFSTGPAVGSAGNDSKIFSGMGFYSSETGPNAALPQRGMLLHADGVNSNSRRGAIRLTATPNGNVDSEFIARIQMLSGRTNFDPPTAPGQVDAANSIIFIDASEIRITAKGNSGSTTDRRIFMNYVRIVNDLVFAPGATIALPVGSVGNAQITDNFALGPGRLPDIQNLNGTLPVAKVGGALTVQLKTGSLGAGQGKSFGDLKQGVLVAEFLDSDGNWIPFVGGANDMSLKRTSDSSATITNGSKKPRQIRIRVVTPQ